MKDKAYHLPLLPLKNTIVFPTTSSFLIVGRDKSIEALKAANERGGKIVVLAQKTSVADSVEITIDNLYHIGTLCQIRNITGSDKSGYQILVTGMSRFKVFSISSHKTYLEAIGDDYPDVLDDSTEAQAIFNNLKNIALEIITLLPGTDDTLHMLLNQIEKQDELIYRGASYLKLDVEKMQEFLETNDIKKKMHMLLEQLRREKEVLLLEKDIKDKVGKRLTFAQREVLLREQLKAIKDELGETEHGAHQDLQKKINDAHMPEDVLKVANKEVSRLEDLHSSSPDYHVIRNYLESLCDLPWRTSPLPKINLKKSEEILDKYHYGLNKIKKRILEHLAVTQLKGNLKGPIICLIGPPGVGKTSLGKSIAHALGRKFVRTSLGGVRDESEIRGHRRTYVGSMPGKIIQSIKKAASNNPLILLDEIDKLGISSHGDPASALLEVLDPEQNNTFVDHYLDVPFDLSQVFFVATANRVDTIPAPLKDRMEIIELSSYTLSEKFHIAKTFIIPQVLNENGLTKDDARIEEETIEILVENYTREAGVRELKRVISSLCRGAAYEIVKGADKPLIINQHKVEQYLGPQKYSGYQNLRKWVPGMATGLAWTPIGGDVLYLECIKMPGAGKLKLTGQLGDIMKESAELALSFIKSHAKELNSDFSIDSYDIHLHIPAGAIPKDGPSAGITILTAIASLISEKIVRQDLGMTGEMTLSGSVLPIGGLKEKVIAAHRNKIKYIILPKKNEKDLGDIPDEIKKELKFYPVECISDVLNMALDIKLSNSFHDHHNNQPLYELDKQPDTASNESEVNYLSTKELPMALKDIIQKNVVAIPPNGTIKEAAHLMYENHVGSVVVVDQFDGTRKAPVGIITDRDIALLLGRDNNVNFNRPVKEAMTPNIIVCTPDDGIYQTIRQMRKYGVRRIPVINKKQQLVGIISSDDILKFLGEEFSELSRTIITEIHKEDNIKKSLDKDEALSFNFQ